MKYNDVIVQFCERKLFPNRPEYLNCLSALYISSIGLYNLITQKNRSRSLEIIYWSIIVNGVMSFLLHYTAWYLFKLLDEFSMLIPLWIGLSKILYDLHYSTYCIGLLTVINLILLGLDVFPWFEPYFPLVFTSELLSIIPLYYQAKNLKNKNIILHKYGWVSNKGMQGILICSFNLKSFFS